MSPNEGLAGLAPLEQGLAFAAMCMVEIIDRLEVAYEAGDREQIARLYELFERYTGRMSHINEQIDRLLSANLRVVERWWSMKGDTDVS